MKTFINCSILFDFFDNYSLPASFENEDENQRRFLFKKYLQQETDLYIDEPTNLTDDQLRFLEEILYRNRNETIWCFKENLLDSPYKNKLKSKSPDSFFCIDILDQQEQKRFISKNGYLIGFLHNYLEEWERLKLHKNASTLPVRKEVKGPLFLSWKLLGKYLTPFTDVVFVDNYIFSDESIISSNFEQIVNELDKATPVKYNFLIVTFEGGDKYRLTGKKLYDDLLDLKRKNQWKCDIGLVITTSTVKEHDRGIFTNYLRIYSGDTFNYFNSKNEILTAGTDIRFLSMADTVEAHAAKAALNSIEKKILIMKQKFPDTHVIGKLQNGLLNLV